MTPREIDCPTCRYHPRRWHDDSSIGALCLHPAGEVYSKEFDAMHLIAPCHGWRPIPTPPPTEENHV